MTTPRPTDLPPAASPQVLARLAGLLYLVVIVLGGLGEVLRGGIVVAGDAAATAANLRAAELPWRLSIAGNVTHLACAAALVVILYVLLRPVSRRLALLVVLLDLVSIAVEAASKLPLAVPLFLAGDAAYLDAFSPAQREALAYVAQRVHAFGFGISLVFFGCALLPLGTLIRRSGFLPKVLGPLLQLAGLAYLVNSYALLLSPPLAARLFPAILLPALVAESALCLWLLVRGVDVPRWRARAGALEGAPLEPPAPEGVG